MNIFERPVPPPAMTVHYGDDPDQVIDVYGKQSDGPTVFILHGGFWRPEYDRSHLSHLSQAIAASGRYVALVEYRRIPGDPDSTTSDVAAALAALDAKGGIVIGHSAGGHLALWASSFVNDLARVIALAPVADLQRGESLDLGSGAVRAFLGGHASERPDLDPIRNIPQCQVVVISGDLDDRVPIEMSRSYAAAKEVQIIELEGFDHFAPVDPTSACFTTVLEVLR